MNPIAHLEIGWLAAQPLRHRRDRALAAWAGVLVDLDGVTILGGGDLYAQWHHVVSHGIFAALALSGLAAAFAQERARTFLYAFLAAHLHLACDALGSGVGWPITYFWPLSDWGYVSPVQWELESWPNMLIAAAATALCLGFAVWKGRTPVELFSTAADARVVEAMRRRFRAHAGTS